ncbi:glycosyltransferase family protein [Tautonia sociabilis]|uniref:glycosyltransferase family protein n=1 Tax=Tautonia sociabilis TaxID=2080755 RepID=UPI0013158CDF|nr:glycosyltransferase [Tautonia sociabilis]
MVLEVGCGEGLSAEAYRRRNPGVVYIGIEPDQGKAVQASRRVDRLVVGPADALLGPTPCLAPASVDCLILTRLIDGCPALDRTIDEACRLLATDGVLLAWTALAGDVADRWRARFEPRGMCLVDLEPWEPGRAPFDDGAACPEPHRTLRSILRLVRSDRQPSRLLLQTLAATPICSRIRTEEPDRALRTLPGVRTRTDYAVAPLLAERPGEARVLILQRSILGRRDLEGIRRFRQAGYLIVSEWDDDPSIFPEVATQEALTFRACHCVQTSTQPLAEVLRAFHPVVAVFPNRVFELPPRVLRRAEGPVSIVFAALNRENDWAEIMPALRRVLVDVKDAVRVDVVHDRAFFDALPPVPKTFRPFLPYADYVAVLQQSDIALLPLMPSRFNRCKSDLKYLECAALGVACLAAPTVYADSIRHGETGMVYRSPSEFEAMLRQLIADAALRQSLASAAYREVARSRMLGQVFRERYLWYEQMIARLPELDRDLCDRVPELA